MQWVFDTVESGEGGWIVVDSREEDAKVWWRGEVSLYVEL